MENAQMKKINGLDELKAIELGIMKEIDSFCRERNIRYYLFHGTLLGCIRHHGFIPWDDDIDIAMPRPDFDRFVSSFSSGFCKMRRPGDSRYSYPFAKVYDARTKLVENLISKDDIGVYVDVFPLDGLPEDPEQQARHCQKIFFWKDMIRHKFSPMKRKRSPLRQLFLPMVKFLLSPISYQWICRRMERMSKEFDYASSPCFANLVWGYHFRSGAKKWSIGKKEWLEPAQDGVFEGCKFLIPHDSDSVLQSDFGDYMQLPPIEKRVPQHDFEAFWIAPPTESQAAAIGQAKTSHENLDTKSH